MKNKSKSATTSPLILAVDTSCDDTSASVMCGRVILSNVISSQTQLHKQYGGVFPTVAKQAHKENILPTIQAALKKAKLADNKVVDWKDLDALAVTIGPGLAPALEVGILAMKELAIEKNLPLIAVNHIEAHALSAIALQNKREKNILEKTVVTNVNNLDSKPNKDEINYPVLSVVVSGGHTQFIYFEKIGEYKILGSTIDDAAGECLDKIGRMLNLGYPAGATIEKFAKLGNPNSTKFPLPMTTTKTFDMSFSGLKTFARNTIQKLTESSELSKQDIYDFCASAQYAVFRHITYKLNKLLLEVKINEIWLGGGVAQNVCLKQTIRETIKNFEKEKNNKLNANKSENKIIFRAPFTKRLCMDNAAMIGLVASFKFQRSEFVKDLDSLDRKPRWKIGTKI
jgi:N6-L-threonylcarbamoyladenine synthase